MLKSIRNTIVNNLRTAGYAVLKTEEDWANLCVHVLVANRHPLIGEGSAINVGGVIHPTTMEMLMRINELDEMPTPMVYTKFTFDHEGNEAHDKRCECNDL